MKKHEIAFGIIKIPLDFIIIFISFYIAREIRLVTDLIPQVTLPIQTINDQSILYFALFGAILYVILFASHNLYRIRITNSKVKEFSDIIRYSFYWFLFFLVSIYLGKSIVYETEIPRLIVIFTLIIGTLLVILERIILNKISSKLMEKGIISKNNLLLINNKKDSYLKFLIKDIKKSGVYKVVGYINKNDCFIDKLKYLGKDKDFEKLLKDHKIDEVLYIDSDFSKKQLYHIWDLSRIFGIRYRYVTNSFDITRSNTTLSLINNIPVIEIKNSQMGAWGRVYKRIFDIISSIIGIFLFFPLMIIVGILIKIEDPSGPIIYKNKRIGQKGDLFNVYKFRYIKWKYCVKESYGVEGSKDDALIYEQKLIDEKNSRSGPLYKIKDDPRKTKVGNFIEKYSIDEIPQFFNVLFGNMSIVGPRPHQPREVKKYKLSHKRLLTIKPGITGMAQVNGRDKNTFNDEAKLDIFYIENWSLILDLKIILKTLPIIIKR